jgi:hypothetical protein
MAVLPPIRKLNIEDYASQKGWIGPFLIVMNTFMTTVVSALSKNLTIIDNTTSDIKYMTLSGVPTSTAPVSVAWTKNIIPIAVMLGNIRLASGAPLTLSSAAQIQWQMSQDNKSLQVTNIVGVTPTSSTQYVLTLVCIAG